MRERELSGLRVPQASCFRETFAAQRWDRVVLSGAPCPHASYCLHREGGSSVLRMSLGGRCFGSSLVTFTPSSSACHRPARPPYFCFCYTVCGPLKLPPARDWWVWTFLLTRLCRSPRTVSCSFPSKAGCVKFSHCVPASNTVPGWGPLLPLLTD